MGQVAIGSVFVVILLAGLLVLLPRFRTELDEYEDEDEKPEEQTNSQPPPLAPSATAFGAYSGQSQSGSTPGRPYPGVVIVVGQVWIGVNLRCGKRVRIWLRWVRPPHGAPLQMR